MKICISSGHGKHIRGASGILDEVDEARRVVEHVADYLGNLGVEVLTYHDDVSTSQNENLERIVDWHNAQGRHDLDISVHFNAYEPTDEPMGTEVLWTSEEGLAEDMSEAIANAGGLTNRGPKFRNDLYFLTKTHEVALLIETCFVDSTEDANQYNANFDEICEAIAYVLAGGQEIPEEVSSSYMFHAKGKCSHFGGPEDTGVSASEGLAFIFDVEDAPHLFLPEQPEGTTGLARRLNPGIFYVACRWDYDVTDKDFLANPMYQAVVRVGSRELLAWPADWGPHGDTKRIADLSPGLMAALGIKTDDVVEVFYPARTTG